MLSTRRLRTSLRRHLDEIGKADHEITATDLWHCRVIKWYAGRMGDAGADECRVFGANPPVRSAPIPKIPRVLVVSTNTESEMVIAAARQAHPNAEIVFSRVVGGFWRNFFDCDDYVGARSDELHIPTAIITSGRMRRYIGNHGDTFYPSDRLKEIAERWGIPITFVET